MDTQNKLDIIARTRVEVLSRRELTGENLFLAWGYPTVFFLLAEFAALMLWDEDWCSWLWLGIPIVGVPLMLHFMKEDYERTRRKTINEEVILLMWVFIGFASFFGGLSMGFAGVFKQCFVALLCLLCGMGCFMTGVILQYRPKTVCGIVASVLSAVPLFLQGEKWAWQLVVAALAVAVSLIVPGHLFCRFVRQQRAIKKYE